jgi:hypothetical protein
MASGKAIYRWILQILRRAEPFFGAGSRGSRLARNSNYRSTGFSGSVKHILKSSVIERRGIDLTWEFVFMLG